MMRLFMKKILAAARISVCCGIQIPLPTRVCSIVMCEPGSTRAGNNPMGERLSHLAIGLDPPKVLFVDPKLAFDLGEHPAVLATRMIAGVWCRLKHVGRPAIDYLLSISSKLKARGTSRPNEALSSSCWRSRATAPRESRASAC